MHGREVVTVLDKKLPAGEHTIQYDLSGVPDGIYLLRVQAGEDVTNGKIVKMH